MLSWTRKT